jgi:spermidine synthase
MKSSKAAIIAVSIFLILCLLYVVVLYKDSINQPIIIQHSQNQYGEIFVTELDSKRCLAHSPSKRSPKQSCVLLDNPKYLALDYYKLLFGSLYLNPKPNKALIIGLGGGSIANGLSFLFPHLNLDIVEINPDIPKIAKKYFYFTPNENTRVIVDDGIEFIKNTNTQYDLIIIDAFNSMEIPDSFLTLKSIQSLKSLLSSGGVLAINSILPHQKSLITSLYKQVFGQYFSLVRNDNQIIITGNLPLYIKPKEPSYRSKLKELDIDSKWLLHKFNYSN